MPETYSSYERALARVESLKVSQGVWPGIVHLGCSHWGCETRTCRHRDEWRWTLTYDPGNRMPN